jgi:hypothetical protein
LKHEQKKTKQKEGHQPLGGATGAPGACYKNKLKQNKVK